MRFGDVIPDGGLRLGVMQQWIDAGVLPDTGGIFDAAVAAVHKDEELWFEEDGEKQLDIDEPSTVDAILEHAVAATAEMEIEPGLFERVERLEFDGGNDIYCELLLDGLCERLGLESYELDTGGETEVFSVQSLEGLGALPKLVSLDLDAHGYRQGGHDLAPLEGHPTLQELGLTGVAGGAQVLTSLGALGKVRGGSELPDRVKEALAAKKVEVS